MKRHAIITTEEVFTFLESGKRKICIGEYNVRITNARIRLFHSKGIACVTCGIEGAFFALESHNGENPHLNFYALNGQGNEVLMTKDHIFPKAHGGANELANYQPMCTNCNGKKADKIIPPEA